jgi:hypothetical protein
MMRKGYSKVSALVTEAKEVEVSMQTILHEASKHDVPSEVLRAAFHSWLKSRGVTGEDRMGKVSWEYYVNNGNHYSGWEVYADKPVTDEDRIIYKRFTDLFDAIKPR